MAENKKNSFEDRLVNWAGAENVKTAKALLKNSAISGVWRDKDMNLKGAFNTPAGKLFTTVVPGNTPQSLCRCNESDGKLCAHACAVIMYAGRFGTPHDNLFEVTPNYCSALKKEAWSRLAERAPSPPTAQLLIEAQSEAPHAPSKWENISLTVKICSKERSVPGNLNNLRQLYFDKSLSVTFHYDHFDLQEQQIIRFLALYGEPDGSRVTLEADMTSEFFHCLIGYNRFFKGGHQIKVRGDKAEVVVVKNADRYYPGLRISGALLPINGARVISGRSGCWIGAGGEYFFVAASCEIGFLRNFFRSGMQSCSKNGISEDKVRRMPFPVINLKEPEPQTAKLQILLDGDFTDDDTFTVTPHYIYTLGEDQVVVSIRSGELIGAGLRFHRRDTAKERAFEQMLAMYGFVFDGRSAALKDTARIGVFLEHVLPDLMEGAFAPALTPKLVKHSTVQQIKLRCSYLGFADNSHKVQYLLSAGTAQLDWHTLADAAAGRDDYIKCGGSIFAISDRIGALFRAMPVLINSVDTSCRTFSIPHCNTASYFEMTRELPEASIACFALPDENQLFQETVTQGSFAFSGTLRNYQKQGVDYLCRMTDRGFNVILADEMGLGKTVQLLAMLGRRLVSGAMPALIVAPASLITNWVREAEKFLPGVRVVSPMGNDRKILWKEPDKYDIGVISYTAARIAGDKLRQVNFSYLILDEAQHIKNPGSGNAKNCKNITAQHKIVLSGTPLENSPDDLWSIFDFLQPGMLGTAAAFRKRYGSSVSETPELRHELACRISPFILRRTKSEVAQDLPERTEKIVYCDFSDRQRELYDDVLAEGRKEIASCANDRQRGNAAIFNTLLKLRQICCAPSLLADGRGKDVPSAKEELIHELMDEILDSSHKMLLFSQFTSMLKLIQPVLKEKKIPCEYLDGTTRNRQEKVDNFNNDPDIPLFLLSLKAGGTGLNLTSADTVVIYDPWWNPAAELQAADRTHRIGQDKPVTIYKLVVRNSIEEKILALQGRKRELFNQVIEASQDESAKFSIEELRELLEQ